MEKIGAIKNISALLVRQRKNNETPADKKAPKNVRIFYPKKQSRKTPKAPKKPKLT